MTAMRAPILCLCGLLLGFPAAAQDRATEALKPMARAADPGFEVATVKPADPNDHSQGFQLRGRHIFIENESVTNLICFAYSIQQSQLINASSWLENVSWDIDGVPDVEGYPNMQQYRHMVEKLLTGRFALRMHHEKRELSVYALTVAKGGVKLTQSKSTPDAPIDQTGHGDKGQQSWRFTNNTMGDFAMGMQFLVGKPIVDQTNLPGRFDFMLRWTPDELRTPDPDAPPGLFTAIQEQLGLKLDPTRAPTDVLVIDHAERPSEN